MLLDMNSIGFAAASSNKLIANDVEVQAVFGTLNTIKSLMNNFSDYQPIALWDGRADFRYDLYPQYKDRAGKSESMDELRTSYKSQTPNIQEFLSALGVKQVTHLKMEADDLAYHYSRKFEDNGAEVLLITGDRDWLQLVTPKVRWMDHRKREIVDHSKFEEKTGFKTVRAFVEAKALTGDQSDTIKGVGGIGEKGARELLIKYGSVDELKRLYKMGKTGKLTKAVTNFLNNETPKSKIAKDGTEITYAPSMDAFERNLQLMDLSRSPKIDKAYLNIVSESFNEQRFTELCAHYAFMSILKDIDTWTRIFKQAYRS